MTVHLPHHHCTPAERNSRQILQALRICNRPVMDNVNRDGWLTLATVAAFSALAAYQVFQERDHVARELPGCTDDDAPASHGERRTRRRGGRRIADPEEVASLPAADSHQVYAAPVRRVRRTRSCPTVTAAEGAHNVRRTAASCACGQLQCQSRTRPCPLLTSSVLLLSKLLE